MPLELIVADALASLVGERHRRKDAAELVARRPGLYAFYGDHRAWSDLDLTPAFADQPLASPTRHHHRCRLGRNSAVPLATGHRWKSDLSQEVRPHSRPRRDQITT